MSKLTALIVDDEELAREGLKLLLLDFPNIEIIGLCTNGIEAIKQANILNPDVIFLDIQMPYLDGFEVLELLGKEAPNIIFITAYDSFAVKAFEANALDYLLKPVNPERLKQSISKLTQKTSPSIENFIHQKIESRKNINRILVRDGKNVHVIPVNEILWLQAQDDYVAIKTAKSVFLKLERLGKLELQLNSQKFKRIHRSYILNMDYLQRIEDQRFAVLKDGSKLPVSKSGFTRIFE